MKAIVYKTGGKPQLADIAEPEIQNDSQVLVHVTAVAVKNLDKARVSGKHYSSIDSDTAKVVGTDGVGILNDGTRVYAIGINGMMAEKAIVNKDHTVVVPHGLSDAMAAALPNGIMGSALALLFRAKMQAGETILINGATGFTGKIAVQLARHYGAGKIIATGRNEKALQSILSLGADEIVLLGQDDDALARAIKEIHAITPIDVVLDYLWGRSAEIILSALKGNGTFSHRTRLVTIGSMSGDMIQLSSQVLRSTDITISGSGLGSWTKEEMQKLFTSIIPGIFELAAHKKIIADTCCVSFSEIPQLWETGTSGNTRLVVTIP